MFIPMAIVLGRGGGAAGLDPTAYYVGTVNGTDIYYSTWSLENVSKSWQFQFFRPPPKTDTNNFSGGV